MRFGSLLLILAAAVPASAERLVRIFDVSPGTLDVLAADGMDIAAANAREGWIDVCLPDRETGRAALYSGRYDVLPVEWGMLTDENRGNAGAYYSWEENNAFWATLSAEHSDLVDTPVSIGTSVQGRDIMMIRMSSATGPSYKPAMFFTALTHAREPGGNACLIDFADWLATNYDSDTMATWILDNTQVYFVPIVNPDSYILNCNPMGGSTRKNQSSPDGVDLNRNYPYQWGYDDEGSSPDPYDETYRGPSAGSEPETQTVMNLIDSIDPVGGIHYHTYGGYLLRPFGYNNSNTADEATYAAWSAAMTEYNGYASGQCGDVLGYNANGDAVDWTYWNGGGHPRCMAMTVECGESGFWANQNNPSGLAAMEEECRYMNIWLCMVAPGFVGIGDASGTVPPVAVSAGPVTPNPASVQASMTVSMPHEGVVTVRVLDLAGRIVFEQPSVSVREGDNMVSVPVDGLPTGVYSLRVTCAGGEAGGRFTVVR